jgi:hypothetical protein
MKAEQQQGRHCGCGAGLPGYLGHDTANPACVHHRTQHPEPSDTGAHRIGGGPPLLTSLPCAVHAEHRPASHVQHRHHVWPLGAGGPDVRDNIVTVCATGHENLHALLRLLHKTGGRAAFPETRGYARAEIALARLGYERTIRQAM